MPIGNEYNENGRRVMNEKVAVTKARIQGKIVKLVKCPYCHLLVDKDEVFWTQDGYIEYCIVCRERIVKCPVCQVQTSLPDTKPEPRDENQVWYNPE
jgi:hypothetical protein